MMGTYWWVMFLPNRPSEPSMLRLLLSAAGIVRPLLKTPDKAATGPFWKAACRSPLSEMAKQLWQAHDRAVFRTQPHCSAGPAQAIGC